MKKAIFILFLMLNLHFLYAQDEIMGVWLSEQKDAKIEIYKTAGKYFGKIIWLSEPNDKNNKPVRDTENPDPSLRNQPIKGLVIVKNMIYKGGKWKSGTIYDPDSGKTYKCSMMIDNKGKLKLTGHWGPFSQTEEWEKTK